MTGPQAGRAGSRWRRLRANLAAEHRPCWICGQPIDYTAPAGHPDAFEADHRIPRSLAPHLAEDPANLEAAHRRCNRQRGTQPPHPDLGTTSRDW